MQKIWCQPLLSLSEYRLRGDFAYRTGLWLLKESLVNASVGAWTVVASSDTFVAGLYDTWNVWSDVRFQYAMESTYINPGSWMILRSPAGTKGPYWLVMQHSMNSFTNAPSFFYFTKSQPDLSQMVPHRLPPMTGSSIFTSAILGTSYGGAPMETAQTDCIVADDGSFTYLVRQLLQNGTDNFTNMYFIFNVMDETPIYDTFGAFVFATRTTGTSIKQGDSFFRTEGRGMDPDGTTTTLAMVRKYPVDGTYVYANLGIAGGMLEDPLWNKYTSEPIHVYCSDSGRQGYRGRLVDLYWNPKQLGPGVVAFKDFEMLCSDQCFWFPTPVMPLRVG